MENITEKFVDYLFRKSETITNKILSKAVDCKKDYMSVTCAGARKNRSHWERFLQNMAQGKAELFGYNKRIDGKTAALVNGFNAHSLELDDGQRFAMIHLGASIISAINAAQNEQNFSDNDYKIGIIMGYEAACRVAIAMQPSHKNRGFHAAGTCGTIGSAVGTAFAMGMDNQQLKRVITIAAGSSAGMLEIQAQGSEVKPFNVGRAAMDGLTAAYMGLTDFKLPDDMIGGERGFFKTFAESYDDSKLTKDTDYYEIERIYVKPYASCRHSHSAVEAAIRIHNDIDAKKIKSVIVETYNLGVKGHNHTDIQGIASAKISTPYAVAAALMYGKADLSVFEPLDEKIIELTKKVKLVEIPELTEESPKKRIAIVTVTTIDNNTIQSRVDYAKGDPENPMTEEELSMKTQQLLAYMAD